MSGVVVNTSDSNAVSPWACRREHSCEISSEDEGITRSKCEVLSNCGCLIDVVPGTGLCQHDDRNWRRKRKTYTLPLVGSGMASYMKSL